MENLRKVSGSCQLYPKALPHCLKESVANLNPKIMLHNCFLKHGLIWPQEVLKYAILFRTEAKSLNWT